jgi:hypothetical protein
LYGDSGGTLSEPARAAFLRGLVVCAVISGVAALALAIFAAVTFRGVGLAPRHTGEHQIGVVA